MDIDVNGVADIDAPDGVQAAAALGVALALGESDTEESCRPCSDADGVANACRALSIFHTFWMHSNAVSRLTNDENKYYHRPLPLRYV
jgi:hypothetical protein